MISRRSALQLLTLGCSGVVNSAGWALDKQLFVPAGFEAALKTGKPILVEVSASWCPVCKTQAPILNELVAQPRFKDLVFLDIDFDSQKEALRGLRVVQQSTLIVFKDGREVGRSVGDTNRASIEALLARAV
ncbi:thiol-disulfide isomerase/thioredoxin [Bosea sp. BE271]|jgi:thiol-disulfide isomerase/thioredoxin|uniref:thioredoxin family protein n=1 Tax=Bosea TaxID=85413 RepID=UPI00286150F0|nr:MULTISPECIES: thioredoxin family protein [Bosea]MDR6830776.1 thiol-disulfide isomerase/thioredoxin [Bosea robiniae]MDR6895433.1 thiol-disulfide isomerase/thioredoxin [Bosea sp. BE109]MDR7138829.1 thiol-disulfide isomerase/thioredoxin [Bosea sp. BE168]MDR7175530.1 thiol-disulfide isomerase/thioredoxin [Bosea sp. BE271]